MFLHILVGGEIIFSSNLVGGEIIFFNILVGGEMLHGKRRWGEMELEEKLRCQ